jgi:hypothetical protein
MHDRGNAPNKKDEPITTNPDYNYDNPNLAYNNNLNNTYDERPLRPNEDRNDNCCDCDASIIRAILAWAIIVLVIIDFINEIVGEYINLISLIGDALDLGLSSLYLYYYYKRRGLRGYFIGFLTIAIWFGGFGLKGIGLSQHFGKIEGEKVVFAIIAFCSIMIRGFILFCYIPMVCPN